ncbi:MAG: hypothetical protein K5871_11340 [Lachnospiraceae bacterium]|nr:hypothetical protein [Lachnospiraceae bacterium]
MRVFLYSRLVNARPGIAYRYHRFHDGSSGIKKFLSWFYLLWLNFAYYVLFCRFLGKKPASEFYEYRNVPCDESESALGMKDGMISAEDLVRKLSQYDVISFDVFDTLIFRPFSDPTDLFYIVGEKLGFMDFKNARVSAENSAREKGYEERHHYEVTLEEIWRELSSATGLDFEEGMNAEIRTELDLCYANPYMLNVWKELSSLGKKLIITSDMYLPEKVIEEILGKNGFEGYEKLYVSCEYGRNKYEGRLYESVKDDFKGFSLIHVGDNPRSDVKSAKKAGLDIWQYPYVGRYCSLYRPHDMSAIVGSAYRGVTDNHIYNGLRTYSRDYEYGFIYGGLFVLGYCRFIHDTYVTKELDKILFLSRDGDVLKKAYDGLYPGDNTEYALWSRKAAVKLMAGHDKRDYFRRFIDHKSGKELTISELLDSMELSFLLKDISGLKPDDKLDTDNAKVLKKFLNSVWDKVIRAYEEQDSTARKYYAEMLKGCGKAAVVDIGWAGSGALSLSYLAQKAWNIPCEILGIVAGTNTVHNAEPDASESFLQSGKLVSYLYSQSHNRDLLKKHDPNKDYNLFWEMLLASPEPCFIGFYPDGPHFGKADIGPEKALEIQKGVLDFVSEYSHLFSEYQYMTAIGGRDAYAPVIAASGHGEKFFKEFIKGSGQQAGI